MEISGLPIPEVFAFSFNTLLCDMLMLSSEYREQILEAQKNLLEKCVNALEINDHEGDVEKSGTYYLFKNNIFFDIFQSLKNAHSSGGPETLKKSRPKNLCNQINKLFFFV